MQIGIDPKSLIITLIALLVFGIAYNALVARIGSRRHRGFTSLLVAAGVMVTLLGVAALDLQASLITAIAFVASGTPMILGSIIRYVKAREAEEERARQDALDALISSPISRSEMGEAGRG